PPLFPYTTLFRSHLRLVGLAVRRTPDLAVAIAAVSGRLHVPDDLLADILALPWRAVLVERGGDHAANVLAAGRNGDLGIGAVVRLGLPDAFHRVRCRGAGKQHDDRSKFQLHGTILPDHVSPEHPRSSPAT